MFAIGYTARFCGLSEASVRRYEKEGLITPQRTTSGIRLFSPQDLKRIVDIKARKVAGRPRKARPEGDARER